MIEEPMAFKGPLGSAKNYITHIVLPNCKDYLVFKENNRNETHRGTPTKYTELRLFLNAAESINNIFDYIHWDFNESSKDENPKLIRDRYIEKHSFLGEIADIANAYKHRVRGRYIEKDKYFKINKNKIHASDLNLREVKFTVGRYVGSSLLSVEYNFLDNDNESLIRNAFQILIKYINE